MVESKEKPSSLEPTTDGVSSNFAAFVAQLTAKFRLREEPHYGTLLSERTSLSRLSSYLMRTISIAEFGLSKEAAAKTKIVAKIEIDNIERKEYIGPQRDDEFLGDIPSFDERVYFEITLAPKSEDKSFEAGSQGGIIPPPSKNDKQIMHSFRLFTHYREAARQVAKSEGMDLSEFMRRACMAAIRDPSILRTVDDMEADYRKLQGPSRHHK